MVEQPNFDDERTLLHARPVVPLERVDVRVKHRRAWFLGGAFAVAMLLGAASALVSAYFKIRNVPEAEIQPEIQTMSVLPEASVSSVPPVSEQPVETASPAVVQEPRHRLKPRPRNTDNTDYTRMSEDEALHQIRNTVLVDQWQERRARRVERRERRRAQHHDRDASNINEIFEGMRRP